MTGKPTGKPRRDPLPVRSVAFLGGMATPDGWRPPAGLPEVAFVGRSNAGKSSLLNSLLRRASIARVSKTPGRTREINFFRVNDTFVLTDLPGYGYARLSKEQRAQWRPLVESYFRHSAPLRGVVQVLDVRRDPSDDDFGVRDMLADIGVPVLVVATKLDTLGKRAGQDRMAAIASALAVEQDGVVAVSNRTGEGRDDLALAILGLLDQPRP